MSFTKTVALDVAGANICVNAIACGAVMTPSFEEYLAEATDQQKNSLYQIIPSAVSGPGRVRLSRRLPRRGLSLPGGPSHQPQRRRGHLTDGPPDLAGAEEVRVIEVWLSAVLFLLR